MNCETDFVARNDLFKDLVKDLTLQIAASEPSSVDELLNQPFIKNLEQTVGDLVKERIAKLGENIVVRRFQRMALGEVVK